MHALLRSLSATAVAAVFVAACSAGATSTPAPTPTPTPIPTPGPTATPTPTPTATPTPAPTPTPTPAAVIDPKGWSFFTWSGTFNLVSEGTDDGRGTVTGIVITATNNAPDPRVSGDTTLHFSVKYGATSTLSLEYGTMSVVNSGGSWTGTCAGPAWAAGNASDVTCWLTGRGAYAGFTLYHHARTTFFNIDATDLIYRGSPPKQ